MEFRLAGARNDVAHGRALVALLGEFLARGLEQAAADVGGPAPGIDPRSRVAMWVAMLRSGYHWAAVSLGTPVLNKCYGVSRP